MVDYFEAKIGIGEAAHRNPVGVRESRGTLLLDYGTHGSNHQFRSRLSSPTPFPGAQDGIAAARASRSKLSASSKTAFLAPGSVNCPATSRASSARLSHSKASFNIDSIWSSPSSFVFCLFRSQNYVCVTNATSRPKRKPQAKSRSKARPTEAAPQ